MRGNSGVQKNTLHRLIAQVAARAPVRIATMNVSYPDISLGGLLERHVGWLTGTGGPMSAMIGSDPVRLDHYKAASSRVASRR